MAVATRFVRNRIPHFAYVALFMPRLAQSKPYGGPAGFPVLASHAKLMERIGD
jgi:hypothetical protein